MRWLTCIVTVLFIGELFFISCCLPSGLRGLLTLLSCFARDVKPGNVGFSCDGNVKLFDFGLARMHVRETDGEWRRLTGNTGTPRYMAPEVACHGDYDHSADVYSFALFLWTICTLDKPFGNFSCPNRLKQAVSHQRRPPLGKIADPRVRSLLKACWDPDPHVRPTFPLIEAALCSIVDKDNETVLKDLSNSRHE